MTEFEHRLAAVEAELAIRNVIARYGLAADCGNIEIALTCHTKDATYIVSNPDAGRNKAAGRDLELVGHEAIATMLQSERHQSLLPNCAHTAGPLVVEIMQDTAKVIGYSRVYNAVDGDAQIMRVAFNRWDMRKDCQDWKIARRESRVMGEEAAQDLLQMALSPHEDSL